MLAAGIARFWEIPELTSINKLPARATFDSYPSLELAKAGDRGCSPWFQSLNGDWDFRFFESPGEAQFFIERHFRKAARKWGKISVPSNWQMKGHHFPHYTNVNMPFREMPPFTPEHNPTGIYRRRLNVPAEWDGLRVILHFGSADSVLALYVNGSAVGLSKDSRLPAEFDITPLLRPGGPQEVVALVVQYSDASFLEDQDMWRLGGLPREVFAYATPQIQLANIRATPHVDLAAQTAELEVLITAGFPSNVPIPGTHVTCQLLDPQGRRVLEKPVAGQIAHERWTHSSDLGETRLRIRVPKPRLRLWSHEDPALYTLTVSLTPPPASGIAGSHAAIRVGFRKVEIRQRNLLINGQRVIIKGVNHHEHHPDFAKAVPLESLRQDVVLMKRFNFNAVRLSHYPHDPRFLDLCDEYGLYAIDEANAESHDFHNLLCKDPRYATPWLDRAQRMVIRDFNHPSVIAWSLGNESGYGPSHDAAAAWIRHSDPSRPVHYEGAISRWQTGVTWMHGSPATDVICPMYPALEELEDWLDFADSNCPPDPASSPAGLLAGSPCREKLLPQRERPDPLPIADPAPHPLARPVILCEYSHAMGNSNGSLHDYFRLFKNRAGLQGGFIWEWLDHGLRQKAADGRGFFAYGGDFGDKPNDCNFVCDGMVSADRIPHPACHEHHRLAQPVDASLVRAKGSRARIRIRNEFDFSTMEAAGLQASWTLQADGRKVRGGLIPAAALKNLPPGAACEVTLTTGPLPAGAREPHLRLEFSLTTDRSWAPAGHIVASAQLALPPCRPAKREGGHAHRDLLVTETAGGVEIHTAGRSYAFERKSGMLCSLRCNGRERLARGPLLELWRAAVDNDGIRLQANQSGKALSRWLELGLDKELDLLPERFLVKRDAKDGTVTVTLAHRATTVKRRNWDDILHVHRYRIHPGGILDITHDLTIAKDYDDLPRIGIRLDLAPGFERLRYFGRGPFENYCDRKTASDLGIWENTVSGEYVDYVMPQEHGHHTDTRWLELSHTEDRSDIFRVEGLPSVEFNATHFTAGDLFAARHTTDLRAKAETVLYLDYAQRGLGTGSCGPDTLPQYRVSAEKHTFAFRILT